MNIASPMIWISLPLPRRMSHSVHSKNVWMPAGAAGIMARTAGSSRTVSIRMPRPESYFRRGLEELHKAYEANQPVDFLETTTKRSLKTALS